MGKISIKHFLNTNLKPYLINKQKYYTIYLLITAHRKTTKVKSIVFDEYYSESDYNNIFNSTEIEDQKMIENELYAVNLISELVINELKEFDTTFLAAFYNFSNTIDIWTIDNEVYQDQGAKVNLYIADQNSEKLQLDIIKTSITDIRSITLYEYFNKENQEKVKKELERQNITDINQVLKDINKTFFYGSLKYFEFYINGNKKNAELRLKYNLFFESQDQIINTYIVNKYKKI